MDPIRSIYSCECCNDFAVYYSNNGPYKLNIRCFRHRPSALYIPTGQNAMEKNQPIYGTEGNKSWVYAPIGLTIQYKAKVDKIEWRPKKYKKDI